MDKSVDLFGLKRERRIVRSRVRDIFTPHQPVQSVELFFGRQAEVQRLIEYLNTPGQHALLFGDRGVGKSSLANITADLLLQNLVKGKLIRKRCDSGDTFVSIVAEPLSNAGIDIQITSNQQQKAEGGSAGLSIPVVKAGIDTKTTRTTTTSGYQDRANSPSWVAQQIGRLEGLFLIDEVDAIQNPYDKKRLAELVKLLSDAGSSLKILLVGIAETAADLTASHQSVQRCLRETRLARMSPHELEQIIIAGQKKLKLQFTTQAIQRIVAVSSGYPHFTHLLALKAAEDAIAEKRSDISVSHVEVATRRAVEDAEGSLKRTYDAAIRSSGTDAYKKILLAAATCKAEEIVAQDLRKAYERLWQESLTQGSLNNYLQRLVSEDGTSILRRLAKGVYRFTDPRMPSYVRIAQSHITESVEQRSGADAIGPGSPRAF